MPPASSSAQEVLKFNLGMDLDVPATQGPFNLGFSHPVQPTPANLIQTSGMDLDIPGVQGPFNFGFGSTVQPTPANVVQLSTGAQPLNLGFNLPIVPPASLQPISGVPIAKPFNLGFNIPVESKVPATASPLSQLFNLSVNIPVKAPVNIQETSTRPPACPPASGPSQHVGYDSNNRAFEFGCQLPTPVSQWQPELIKVPEPSPPQEVPALAGTSTVYSIVMLPNSDGHLVPPTLASLVIDIVQRLGGEEFDELAQMMVGAALDPGDDVRDPHPDEVLATNRVMLIAFCKTRDRLTQIFKDLISLHHISQAHQQVVPTVASLLQQIEAAEAKTMNAE
ncbi:uncharacterized protein EDB93DRAFT_1109308 [Suillus bovinus]|uniref:uncharacterized protein n=1 Tax=Suillus bovinus TaxID=48563 RepID=UPI001B874348|nr:uncharacterized protein EDB93DRAFT_1109308 [Suillus bovinus]KAG2127452.1 hypothetical protein EDB93DRAFT_1109308 [Suillus bovinus]